MAQMNIHGFDRKTTKTKYADIMMASRPPLPTKHRPMSLGYRAKLFSPYAAIRSFNEKISDAREDHPT